MTTEPTGQAPTDPVRVAWWRMDQAQRALVTARVFGQWRELMPQLDEATVREQVVASIKERFTDQ